MNNLGELHNKFNTSGLNGNPVITDLELNQLHKGLTEMGFYFAARKEWLICGSIMQDAERVHMMIEARKRS